MPTPDLSAAQQRLAAAQAAARRRALGRALHSSDKALDALSAVGPEIIPEVVAFIRAAAGAEAVGLFLATVDHNE